MGKEDNKEDDSGQEVGDDKILSAKESLFQIGCWKEGELLREGNFCCKREDQRRQAEGRRKEVARCCR